VTPSLLEAIAKKIPSLGNENTGAVGKENTGAVDKENWGLAPAIARAQQDHCSNNCMSGLIS